MTTTLSTASFTETTMTDDDAPMIVHRWVKSTTPRTVSAGSPPSPRGEERVPSSPGTSQGSLVQEDRHDDDDEAGEGRTDEETHLMATRDDIPVVLSVQDWDDDSDISHDAYEDPRTLTPYPSFDGPTITARDFHFLFQASHLVGEREWPSDEECDQFTASNKVVRSTVKDMGDAGSVRSDPTLGEI
jgi:hypothetical protein